MGWDNKAPFKPKWFGFHPRHGVDHWFDKSQWISTTVKNSVRKLLGKQQRGKHDAFKREHDELKREHDELKREHDELKRDFYATRAYFDNTHASMTDVWDFDRA
jgi:hypothetical protein